MRTLIRVLLLVAAGAFFVLAALSLQHITGTNKKPGSEDAAATGPTQKPIPVKLRLKWKHQGQFAGFYVAEAHGYFREAGLSVQIHPGGPEANALQLVQSGVADIGVWGAEQVLLNRSRGMHVKAIGVVYQRTAACWMVLEKSNIRRLSDFVGKRVGTQQGTDLDVLYTVLLRREGIDRAKIQEQVVGFNVGLFLDGRFDVWPSYSVNEPFFAQKQGVAVRVLYPHEMGLNFYGDVIFATDEYLAANGTQVRAFMKAVTAGWKDALSDPSEAARITCQQEPVLALDHQEYMIRESTPLISPQGQTSLLRMDDARWREIATVLSDAGLLQAGFEVNDVFTNDYLP